MTSTTVQSIDEYVNYESEYRQHVKKAVVLGNKMKGLCPFHQDSHESFSVDLKTGKWHCFTEDIGGNFLDFYAKIHNCDTKEAYKAILKQYGKFEENPASRDYTLEQYAKDKHFDKDWLVDTCALSTGTKKKSGTKYLKIPYFDESGKPTVYRERYSNKEFKWGYGSAGKINLYGEWRMGVIRQGDSLILVEGESDSQSLWAMGLPALGVPGASLFKPEHTNVLSDMPKLYIHKEQDAGGEAFVKKTVDGLKRGGYEGDIYIFSCGSIEGCKDPSDVYMKHGAGEGKAKIIDLVRSAAALTEKDQVPETIKGAPVNLRIPGGWYYDESGIYEIKPKTFEQVLICGTPIIITRRVKSIDTDSEKIGIAILRTEAGHKKWVNALFARDAVFTSKATTTLTNLGAMVNSENTRQVVRFLSALETANDDIIPWGESTSVLGWHSGGRFLPGISKGLITDFDEHMGAIVASYHTEGTFDKWKETMAPFRGENRFRFILAASFAAPMIKLLHQRTFFVYNWGDSRGGKTAALKAALSAWGDPDGLMMNFNTTQVGLERQAALFTDLPLGIDERQAAGSGERGQSKIENLVYMIGEGKGRTRGAKEGGIQKVNKWRTIALATGEEPLANENSMTGIISRSIEICQGPFKDEADAAKMHVESAANYGFAGPEFVRHLIKTNIEELKDYYNKMSEYVSNAGKGKASSHVAGIALIALADALADKWIFSDNSQNTESALLKISPKSWDRACEMAEEIMGEQMSAEAADVNLSAALFLADWISINKGSFTRYATQRLGVADKDGDTVYIISTAFSDALKNAGYNERKTKRYLAEKKIIKSYHEKKEGKKSQGRIVYSTVKRLPVGDDDEVIRIRVVEFSVKKAMDLIGEAQDNGHNEWMNAENIDLPFD